MGKISAKQTEDQTLKQVNVSNTTVELSKDNFSRAFSILVPASPDTLARYCRQGFEDALRFLQSRYMISCTRCMGVASSYEIEKDIPHNTCAEFDPDCGECTQQREEANSGTVPLSVVEVFDKYIEKVDKSYGEIIHENKLLNMMIYIAMIATEGILWLLKLFFPKLAKMIDQAMILFFGGQYVPYLGSHTAKYTCQFNITQYGEDSMTDLAMYSEQERRESVKDILNLSLVACLESDVSPHLPFSQEEAKKFQKENLTAAVFSNSGHSSQMGSLAPSIRGSRAVSRMGSRVNSEDNLCALGDQLPGTIEQIKYVTDNQESVMAFYYRDSSSQVKMMEIFDVTQTDPSLLVKDQYDFSLDSSSLRSSLETSRSRHQSAPSSLHRHPCITTISDNIVKRNTKQQIMNKLSSVTSPRGEFQNCNGKKMPSSGQETDNECRFDQNSEQRLDGTEPGLVGV